MCMLFMRVSFSFSFQKEVRGQKQSRELITDECLALGHFGRMDIGLEPLKTTRQGTTHILFIYCM